MDINIICKQNKKDYYNNLINYSKLNDLDFTTYSKKLKELEDQPKEIKTKEINKKIESIDDFHFKKPWIRLQYIHKISKLKEFVSKLLINEEEQEKLIIKLINLLDNKYFMKKDRVKYDKIKGIIVSIPDLKYIDGRYHMTVS